MNVVIFGSGGMAKEVIAYIESEPVGFDDMDIAYVVSPQPFNNPAYKHEVRERADPNDNVHYILAVSEPHIKRKIVAENLDRWITYTHHTAWISRYATIGRGCIFGPGAIVCGDPVIERFCFFNTNAAIGHDSSLGAYSTLFPNTEICGDCTIGDDFIMGIGAYILPGVTLASGSKVSAGAIVRESHAAPSTIYGDPRGLYRIKEHGNRA
jgi:sugar O-acyltransferase (sialic acid O-acetyltransferase NeuD family)